MDTAELEVKPTPSVAEHLRDSFRKRQSSKQKDVKIPGYDGLYVTFRALDDYTEVRDAIQSVVKKKGLHESEREIEIGVETLLLASITSYAIIDEQKIDIGLPLGLDLYDYIFPHESMQPDDVSVEIRPENDSQAVIQLFDNTMALMVVVSALDQWFKGEGLDSDEALLGE